MASTDSLRILPQGAGYGIIVGIGGVFALLMLGITWMQNRYVRDISRTHTILDHKLTDTDAFLDETSRGVQYCIPICEAWIDRRWNRVVYALFQHSHCIDGG